MRFLCLHGRGTNAKVFKMQTAAIRYDLGEGHSYDFVEGSIPVDIDPGVKGMLAGNETGYNYFDEHSPASALQALYDLDSYVELNGPYDGIIAFSQSVGLVGTWLVYRQRRNLPGVRCAVFLSGGSTALDPDVLSEGAMVPLSAANVKPSEILELPTAHIYGALDPHALAAQEFSALCSDQFRSVFIHPGGHEVPGSGSGSSSKDVLNQAVNVVRRVITLAGA
ncbi:hypothetical protein DL770_008431 [Monosporascus sp. CRB-9-2]|nr:hypothetical protein DL770_008431 [Monosporascus sp. CRB-9-2]